jgi:hypothetical protein
MQGGYLASMDFAALCATKEAEAAVRESITATGGLLGLATAAWLSCAVTCCTQSLPHVQSACEAFIRWIWPGAPHVHVQSSYIGPKGARMCT